MGCSMAPRRERKAKGVRGERGERGEANGTTRIQDHETKASAVGGVQYTYGLGRRKRGGKTKQREMAEEILEDTLIPY